MRGARARENDHANARERRGDEADGAASPAMGRRRVAFRLHGANDQARHRLGDVRLRRWREGARADDLGRSD
jgi:hypothetical protein